MVLGGGGVETLRTCTASRVIGHGCESETTRFLFPKTSGFREVKAGGSHHHSCFLSSGDFQGQVEVLPRAAALQVRAGLLGAA